MVQADEIIKKAELECENCCEKCGARIGTEWSPKCQTTGWITYLCDECAEKHNGNYIKNGELWCGETRLKTKEQMNSEQTTQSSSRISSI